MGLAPLDTIVSLDGVPITSMGELVVALRTHQPGDTVALDVIRDHQRLSMVVVLSRTPGTGLRSIP